MMTGQSKEISVSFIGIGLWLYYRTRILCNVFGMLDYTERRDLRVAYIL